MALAGSEKSKTTLFFVVSQILMLVALYSLYDEGVLRRPWKQFQTRHIELQMSLAEKNFAKAQEEYKANGGDEKLKELELNLEKAEIAKESDEYKSTTQKLDHLQLEYDDAVLEVKFNKSILDSYYYIWKHGVQQGHASAQDEKNYHDLEKKIAEEQKNIESKKKEIESIKATIASYDEALKNATVAIESHKKGLVTAEEAIKNVKTRSHEIKQIIVKDLGVQGNIYWDKVDRCQTCHVAVLDKGYEDVAEAYGFTVVKTNQEARDLIKKDPAYRGQVITEAQKQHMQIMYGTHPKLQELVANHDPEKFGCTSCHGGDGRGLQIKHLEFATLNDDKFLEGEEAIRGAPSQTVKGAFGHEDKAHATHHHAIESLLRGKQTETNCLSCHMGQIYIDDAQTISKGASLFVDLGCQGCHLVKGYDGLYKVGPELNRVSHKTDATWLVDWIKNPKNYMPNSRMPMFGLQDEEVVAVASYLMANSKDYTPARKMAMLGDATRGKKTFDTVGCVGCHKADDSDATYAERNRAPNLARVSAKLSAEWVYDWILNPKNYSEHARMPSLRLSEQEASDITAYLMSQNKDYRAVLETRSQELAKGVDAHNKDLILKGKKIMSDRGCYACHTIDGFAGMDRIGPELSGEALKETFEFDFGDAMKDEFTFKDEFGNSVYVAHGPERAGEPTQQVLDRVKKPDGVQDVTNLENTWQSWVRNKIRYPQSIYAHARASLKMPNFNLSPTELDALMSFLKAMQRREIPEKFNAVAQPQADDLLKGQRLVAQYNCMGCHSIHGLGGDINAHIDTMKEGRFTQFYPPSLDSVGEKIRPEWLYNFLDKPTVYRPQMEVRMPTFNFTEDEINTLVDYFASMTKSNISLTRTDYHISQKYLDAAKLVAGPEAYNCFSCHINQGKKPGDDPANWAPDWALMRDRLQYDFITKWIKAPAQYQKFAVMPAMLNSDDEAYPDLLGGKAEEQLKALRDMILNASQKSAPVAPVETAMPAGQ